MGQRTMGMLYGVETPELPDTTAATFEDELWEALLRRFHTAAGIDRDPRWDDAHAQPSVTLHYDERDTTLLGVWIAVGGSGEPGTPYLVENAIPLESLAQVYAAQITIAQALWHRFATYCAEQEQITLAIPQLWITPTEVA